MNTAPRRHQDGVPGRAALDHGEPAMPLGHCVKRAENALAVAVVAAAADQDSHGGQTRLAKYESVMKPAKRMAPSSAWCATRP